MAGRNGVVPGEHTSARAQLHSPCSSPDTSRIGPSRRTRSRARTGSTSTFNSAYRDALGREQRDAVAGKFLYPPSYQWLLSPRIWDPFRNLVVLAALASRLGAAAVGRASA